MSTNYSAGPWEFDEDRFIVSKNGKSVVEYAGCGSHKANWPNKANKNLVLAAPELLEALKNMVEFYQYAEFGPIEAARKAIAKAQGEAK